MTDLLLATLLMVLPSRDEAAPYIHIAPGTVKNIPLVLPYTMDDLDNHVMTIAPYGPGI